MDIGEAAFEAQDYTWHSLEKAYRPGMGQWLPDRLFWAREEADEAAAESRDDGGSDARGRPAEGRA